mmetsp:Transcript_36284/g.86214  ORF Transcript_36284/g.86214 Transcript_36284/m.86214 type:complete len:202 (-) Transcript_36284:44-649(-)
MKVHAALTGADGVSGEYAAMRWKGSAAKSCLAATPTRRVCFKEGTHAKGPIFAPLVLARLGVGASAVRRSSSICSLPSGAGCSSKIPADACMVKPVQVERSPAVAAVKDEPEEEEPLDLLATSLDLSQLLRLSCARAVRQGEIREQVGLERTSGSEAHAFEDHLYLAEPTRRTRMTRNNACLDLGALCKRARPSRMEETCE